MRRLFAGYRAVELDHFRTTGVVPIMHLVVLNREIVDDRPWVANNLYAPFLAARVPAVAQLLDTAVCTKSLVWESDYAEEEREALGDPFAYGVEENTPTLGAVLRYAHDQWLLDEAAGRRGPLLSVHGEPSEGLSRPTPSASSAARL